MTVRNRALCLMAALTLAALPVSAQEPYNNYSFSWNTDYGEEVFPYVEPQAYVPAASINGTDQGVGPFANPQDVAIGPAGDILIADTGNSRIVRLHADLTAAEVLETVVIEGQPSPLREPQGIFAAPDGKLLIADTGNARVLLLDAEWNCLRVYETPQHRLIPADYAFRPVSAAMDQAQRLYVVSEGENQGILEFDKDGNFKGFMGAIEVEAPGFLESLWKLIRTSEQQERSSSWIPTEYNGIDIDEAGFVYGTVSATEDPKNFVRRLNPMGINILRQDPDRTVSGDLFYATVNGEAQLSKMVDVAAADHNMYSVLDERKGRVFTYDGSGSLLFVFGCIGDSFGAFSQPVALDVDADHRIYVADARYNHVLIFRPTAYAERIYTAVIAQNERRFEQAEDAWAQVLQYSVHSDMAYIGMGKVLMRQQEYQQAMRYFEAARSTENYGEAYKLYRQEVMQRWFPAIVLGVVLLVLLLLAFSKRAWLRRLFRRRKKT